jgi:hypothetical protein
LHATSFRWKRLRAVATTFFNSVSVRRVSAEWICILESKINYRQLCWTNFFQTAPLMANVTHCFIQDLSFHIEQKQHSNTYTTAINGGGMGRTVPFIDIQP